MALRICAVFHSEKQEGAVGKPPAVAVNPPMTMRGMERIDRVAEKIKRDPRFNFRKKEALPPFSILLSSPLARALDVASVLALHFNMDIQTVNGLSQMANKEGEKIILYPGHEDEDVVNWQFQAFRALQEIAINVAGVLTAILLVSHRPIIGGLVAKARGIVHDREGLDRLIKDPELVKDGYVVLDYDSYTGNISEVERA